ncbi:histidine kinase [Microbispora sp. NPDC049125]|uniref:sensor histidine kinase n=1 Tax=Microbispora sp. NPDC049125 TaxID=3154929 RepID=UPI003467E7E2
MNATFVPHGAALAPRVAGVITATVIIGFFLVALTYAFSAQPSPWTLVGMTITLAVLLSLQFVHSFPALFRRWAPNRRLTLALQAALTYVPFLFFKAAWLGMPGFLAASVLLVMGGSLAYGLFALVVASAGVLQFLVGYRIGDLAYNLIATVLTALVVYGLSRLSDLVRELQYAREEVARLAVTEERLRIARDLHDLLGYSLSTITLKCELTYRLVPVQPERAQQELTEVLHTAREALTDVRSVAVGYRTMSLAAEVHVAETTLAAVGITVDTRVDTGTLQPAVDTVLATILREGLTNMLRHSKAQRCRIAAWADDCTIHLTLENDGVGSAGLLSADHRDPGGNGIRNLTERVTALGGDLTAEALDGQQFRLAARLPLAAAVHSQPD